MRLAALRRALWRVARPQARQLGQRCRVRQRTAADRVRTRGPRVCRVCRVAPHQRLHLRAPARQGRPVRPQQVRRVRVLVLAPWMRVVPTWQQVGLALPMAVWTL